MNKKLLITILLSLILFISFSYAEDPFVHCFTITSVNPSATLQFNNCAVSGNFNVNGTNYTTFATPGATINVSGYGQFNFLCDDGVGRNNTIYAIFNTAGTQLTNAANGPAFSTGDPYCEGSGSSMHKSSSNIGYGNNNPMVFAIGTNQLGGQTYSLVGMRKPIGGSYGSNPQTISSGNYFVGNPSLLVMAPSIMSENFNSKSGMYEKEIFFTLVNTSPLTDLIDSYEIKCPAGVTCTIDQTYSQDHNWPIAPTNGILIIPGKISFNKSNLPLSITAELDLNYTIQEFKEKPACQQKYSTKSVPTTLNFGLLDEQDFQVKLKSDSDQTNCVGEDGMIGQTGEKYAPRVNLSFGGSTDPKIDISECSKENLIGSTAASTTNYNYLLFNQGMNQNTNNYPFCPCDTNATTQDCVLGTLTDGVSAFYSTTLVSGTSVTLNGGSSGTLGPYTGNPCVDRKVVSGNTRYDGYINQGSTSTPTGTTTTSTTSDNNDWVFCSQKEFLVMVAERIGKIASLREQIASKTTASEKQTLALEASRYATFEASIRTQEFSQSSIDAAINQINGNAAGNIFSNLGFSSYAPDNTTPTNQYERLRKLYRNNGVKFNVSSAKAGTYRFEIDMNGLSEYLTNNYLFDVDGNLNSSLDIKVKATHVADPTYNWFFYENGNLEITNESVDSTGATNEQITNVSKRGILLEFNQSATSTFTSAKLFKTFALPLFIRLADNNGNIDTNIFTTNIASDPFTYWTGFASTKGEGCETIAQNAVDTFLPYRMPDTKKTENNTYYLPEFTLAKPNSVMYLETVLYYPLNNVHYTMSTPFKVFTKDSNCNGNSQTKCNFSISSEVTTHDMNSLETIFNGIKNEEVCVYKTVSNNTSSWTVFWNQQKMLSDLNTMKRNAIHDANICAARELLSG